MKEELKFMLESLIETNYDENVIKEITTCKITNKYDFGKFVRLQREMMINAYMYEQNGNNKMRDEFTHRAFILSDEIAELIGIDKEIFDEILTTLVDKPEFQAA